MAQKECKAHDDVEDSIEYARRSMFSSEIWENIKLNIILMNLNERRHLYQVCENLLQIVESDKDNETIQQAMLYLKADISKGLLELSENIIKQHKGEE